MQHIITELGLAFIVAILTVIAAFLGLVAGFMKLWWDIRSVHVIVNNQRTRMLEKIRKLEKQIRESKLGARKRKRE